MVDIILKTLEAADTYDLLTLDEAKLLLGVTETDEDASIQMLITTYSDVVATLCNRVFAKETMRETVRCLQPNRYFVSHYPIADESDVTSVECPRGTVLDPSTYEIELKSGKIEFYGGQSEPIVVTYTGGYELPDEAPPALKQATLIFIREERMAAMRAQTAGIRALTHKESRVVFFDPNAVALKAAATKGADWQSTAANSLLMHYVRIGC
jgi:hypothetical protein